jgi:hypothetical protein
VFSILAHRSTPATSTAQSRNNVKVLVTGTSLGIAGWFAYATRFARSRTIPWRSSVDSRKGQEKVSRRLLKYWLRL